MSEINNEEEKVDMAIAKTNEMNKNRRIYKETFDVLKVKQLTVNSTHMILKRPSLDNTGTIFCTDEQVNEIILNDLDKSDLELIHLRNVFKLKYPEALNRIIFVNYWGEEIYSIQVNHVYGNCFYPVSKEIDLFRTEEEVVTLKKYESLNTNKEVFLIIIDRFRSDVTEERFIPTFSMVEFSNKITELSKDLKCSIMNFDISGRYYKREIDLSYVLKDYKEKLS